MTTRWFAGNLSVLIQHSPDPVQLHLVSMFAVLGYDFIPNSKITYLPSAVAVINL